MNYLFSNQKFVEIEFLGHVFGFPIVPFTKEEFEEYAQKSIVMKKDFFCRGESNRKIYRY